MKHFVGYVSDLAIVEELGEVRQEAVRDFLVERRMWSNRTRSIPYLCIAGHRDDRDSRQRQTTLTVFVHGYQGNSFDFQKAKNYLRRHNKYTQVLIIESITKDMNQSIE